MSNLVKESEGKYYLEPDTEITKDQYDAITAATVSGSSEPTDLIRLHAEQDPASPLYKGSQSTGAGISELASGESKTTSRYYEPTDAELEEASKDQPEPHGTTAISIEEASKPYEPVAEEEAIPEVVTPIPDAEPNTTQNDAGNA
jgi:hypothetical protein